MLLCDLGGKRHDLEGMPYFSLDVKCSNANLIKALVFPVIMNLQKLSNHLALLIPNSRDPPDKQERDLEFLKKMVPDEWRELYANRDSLFNLSNPDFCGKVRAIHYLYWLYYTKLCD